MVTTRNWSAASIQSQGITRNKQSFDSLQRLKLVSFWGFITEDITDKENNIISILHKKYFYSFY